MSLQYRFGAALQLVRKKRGLTQEDFSIVSSRTYLSSLERGLKSPTLDKVDQIAGVMDIHPVSLIALAYLNESNTDVNVLCKRIASEISALKK